MNELVLQGLNSATRITDNYAYLTDENNQSVYTFLYNPESKSFSRQAKYDEGVTALSSLSSQYYKNTSGLSLQLSDLILETYNRSKSCKLLLQRLQALMVANPRKGQYSPTPVKFIWGADSFGPAVITDLSWTETSWLNGEVASARVNLTLLEVPEDSSKQSNSNSQNDLQQALNKKKILTARQKEEASKKAKQWLSTNLKKLSDKLANMVRFNTYKLNVSDNGTVTMLDSKSKLLGTVGNYKDGKFTTYNNNLINK